MADREGRMKIHTEVPMTHDAAWYILKANGWNHREGIDGNEYIQALGADEFGNVVEYNRITQKINIKREMHTQELLAALKVLRII